MKKLTFLLFTFLLMLIFCGKVNAKSYSLEDVSTTFRFMPNNTYTSNNKWNTIYYNGTPFDHLSGFQTKFNLINSLDVLNEGRYLISFIIYGEGFINNITCNNLTSNFKNVNMTTGNLVSNEITSSCVDLYKTTHNGYGAIRLLYEFTYKNRTGSGGITEFDFSINTDYNYFILGGDYGLRYALSVNDIQDYDLNIINTWNTDKSLQTQINQNDTIIDQNNQTNDKLDQQIQQNNQIKDTLNNSSVDDPSGNFNQFESYLPENGVITELITLPISLFQRVLSSINGTCSQYNLGNLMGTDLILPCINISNYIGMTLWNVIDILFSGFFVLVIGKKMIKAFNNFSSMEEGDVLD